MLSNDDIGVDNDGFVLEVIFFIYIDGDGQIQTGVLGSVVDMQYGFFMLNVDGFWIFDLNEDVDFGVGMMLSEGIIYTIIDIDGDMDMVVLDLMLVFGPSIMVNLLLEGDFNLGADGAFVDEDDLFLV